MVGENPSKMGLVPEEHAAATADVDTDADSADVVRLESIRGAYMTASVRHHQSSCMMKRIRRQIDPRSRHYINWLLVVDLLSKRTN